MTTVYLNGAYIDRADARVSADDRGFTFGDGIYEGLRAIRGRLFDWDAHAERLAHGLAGLRIPFDGIAALRPVCDHLLAANALADEAFVYIAVTRGAAPRVHGFPTCPVTPTVWITATPFTPPHALRDRGVAAITHADLRWERCDLKTLNLLGAMLARQAAVEAGAFEAILVRDGIVTEGAATTVLAVVGGELRTHPLSNRILPSVTRAHVLDCARQLALPLREHAMTVDELRAASEILFCGTTTDVTPVVKLDGATVGDGVPGPLTRQLRTAYEARLYGDSRGTPG